MLGIVITPDNSITYREFVALARDAEDAGLSHVFIPEGTNDSLMCAYGVARATSRIHIATYTSNIYFREPALCAASAQMVQDASGGRFTLGLGVGHRQSQAALGIEMDRPREKLRDYVLALRRLWAGHTHPDFPVSYRRPEPELPIYLAATTLETARLAGELADGLELYLSTAVRTIECREAADRIAAEHDRPADAITMTVGLPTFIDEDLSQAQARARENLKFHLALPNYHRQLGRSGFETEAEQLAAAAGRNDDTALLAAISERVLDATSLVGPGERCRERLSAYREAAGERVLPIIFPFPFSGDYPGCVRQALEVFGKAGTGP